MNSSFVRASASRTFWVCAASMLIAACSSPQEPTSQGTPVLVTTVGSHDAAQTQSLAAEVVAKDVSMLGFKVAGRMQARYAEVGERVTAGQTLARLGSEDYNLSRQAVADQLAAARLNAAQLKDDAARFARLAAVGSMGSAEAERQATAAKAAAAQVAQLESQLRLAGNQSSDTVLKAPFSGVVTQVFAESGQVLGAGTPVFELAKSGELEVQTELPEQLVGKIRQASVTASLWGSEARAELRLSELAPEASPVTRTFRAKFRPVGALPKDFRLGSSAKVYVSLPGDKKSVSLPSEALLKQNGNPFVWVVQSTGEVQKPVAQPVKVVGFSQGMVQVLGLSAGQQVISAGAFKVDSGMEVFAVERNLQPKQAGLHENDETHSLMPDVSAQPTSKQTDFKAQESRS